MNINVEHQPNCRAILHVEVPADAVKKERSKIIAYFTSIAKIPGYRPGKVPPAVITSRYKDAIDSELKQQLVNTSFREAIEKQKLNILQVIAVKDMKMGDDNIFNFTAEVSTSPKIELPDYKGIPVKLERVEVTEAHIEHEIYHLRERHQELVDVERAAELNDVVLLNYTSTVDGQPVAEAYPSLPAYFASSDGNMYLLSKTEDFIPGFYAALVGIKKDEQRTLTLPLPEDFHSEELKGKTLVIEAKCVGVKQRNIPELDEVFAAKVHSELTVETLRKEVESSIRQRLEQARDGAHGNQVLAFLHDKMEFEVPQEAVDREAQRRTNDMAMRAMRQGMDQDALMQHQDEIVNAATQQARQSVKVSFILEEVAKAEGITASDGEVSVVLAQMSSRSGKPMKKFIADARKDGTIDRVRDDITMKNTLELLKSLATIEEVEPADAEKHGCAFEEQAA
jgi:trigger factor